MKKSLIALATAGVLASGVAAAESFTLRVDGHRSPAYVTVQDHQDYRQDYRRWHDEGRQLSVDDRQARIHNRIQRGFENGQLTRRELRQLERDLAQIEEKERVFASDGRIGGRERSELHRDLDRLSERLRFERRDAQTRY